MKTVLRICLFAGLPVSLLCFALAAALYTFFDLPARALPPLAALPLFCGCFLTAEMSARCLRHHCIRCGICAALLLSGIWYAACCISAGEFRPPAALLCTLPAGLLGSLLGMSREASLPRRRMHTLRTLHEQAKLLPLLLHRPPKPEPGQETK